MNGVAPALIETRFSEALWKNPEILSTYLKSTPLGRAGQPEEVAGAIVYLASDAVQLRDRADPPAGRRPPRPDRSPARRLERAPLRTRGDREADGATGADPRELVWPGESARQPGRTRAPSTDTASPGPNARR